MTARWACRKDKNHDEIADAFRTFGWSVYDMHQVGQFVPGFPDLIIAKRGMTVLVEVKSEKGKPTPAEKVFQLEWPDWYVIVRDVNDVISVETIWRKALSGRGISIDEQR